MVRGAIVAESLRPGAVIEDVALIVHRLARVDAGLGDQPRQWTLMWFEAEDAAAHRLATALEAALEAEGGWYADFHSDSEVTVVFAGRSFRYRTGDRTARELVEDYARSVGVPESQLDWPES